MAKTYKEKLLDPRWQKKRLEILQRDKFTCQSCGDKDKTLHVHHVEYYEDKEPWEHKNIDLITLCEECHRTWHYVYSGKYEIGTDFISLVVNLHDKLEWEEISRFNEMMDKKRKLHPEKYNYKI